MNSSNYDYFYNAINIHGALQQGQKRSLFQGAHGLKDLKENNQEGMKMVHG